MEMSRLRGVMVDRLKSYELGLSMLSLESLDDGLSGVGRIILWKEPLLFSGLLLQIDASHRLRHSAFLMTYQRHVWRCKILEVNMQGGRSGITVSRLHEDCCLQILYPPTSIALLQIASLHRIATMYT